MYHIYIMYDIQNLFTQENIIILGFVISEILPFCKSIRSNGIIEAIHNYIFHREENNIIDPAQYTNYH